jgi:nucleoside-diphosphate-sugar epimerase
VGYWEQRRVLVSGGGSFIGSHLVEALGRGARVRAVNLGTMERTPVIEAARLVLELTGHHAVVETTPEMPIGQMNRVADNARAREVLGWRPEVDFAEGLRRTVNWYFATKDRGDVRGYLGGLLTERPAPEGWQVPAGLAGRPR